MSARTRCCSPTRILITAVAGPAKRGHEIAGTCAWHVRCTGTLAMKTSNDIQTIDPGTLDNVSGGMSHWRAERLAHHPRYLAHHPFVAARVANRLASPGFHCGTRCGTC